MGFGMDRSTWNSIKKCSEVRFVCITAPVYSIILHTSQPILSPYEALYNGFENP